MILLAIEHNNCVYVYNEEHKEILNEPGHLYNYTSNSVAIARENNQGIIDIYDSDGKKMCTYPFDFVDLSNIQEIIS